MTTATIIARTASANAATADLIEAYGESVDLVAEARMERVNASITADEAFDAEMDRILTDLAELRASINAGTASDMDEYVYGDLSEAMWSMAPEDFMPEGFGWEDYIPEDRR